MIHNTAWYGLLARLQYNGAGFVRTRWTLARRKIDIQLIYQMDNSSLIAKVEEQKTIMIDVATGKTQINDANEVYKKLRSHIQQELKLRGLKNPNTFTDLWRWYGKWREDLPTYQSRRNYVSDLLDPLVEKLRDGSPPNVLPTAMQQLLTEIESYVIDYESYISDSGYGQLIDNTLYAKLKALNAYLTKLNMDDPALMVDQFDMIPGNAVEVLETIRSFQIPEIREQAASLESSQSSRQISYDLRRHLSEIEDKQVRGYVEESVACFEKGLFRAAIIMSWVGAVAVLHDQVVQHHLTDFNNESSRRDSRWKPAKTTDDLANMKEFQFLEVITSISVIGKNVKQELNGCLRLRNGCGHPNTLHVGKNKAAAHLETLTQNVFARFK